MLTLFDEEAFVVLLVVADAIICLIVYEASIALAFLKIFMSFVSFTSFTGVWLLPGRTAGGDVS